MTVGIMIALLRAALLCLAWLGLAAGACAAGDYPSRPVHFINGFAPGGPVDTTARIVGQWLSDRLGQQFVIENRTGSGGNIAAAAAIASPADGYTVLFVGANNAISTSLYKHLALQAPRLRL
jgi:tripartite-type tricarboxylate transporter receptor subunit TctC